MKIKVGERDVHGIPRDKEREKRDNESRVIYLFTFRVKQNKTK